MNYALHDRTGRPDLRVCRWVLVTAFALICTVAMQAEETTDDDTSSDESTTTATFPADGYYFLMNVADSTYFSRGGNYNQQICVQEAGLKMKLTNSTTSTGAFTLQAADYCTYNRSWQYYISTSGNLTGFYQNISTTSPTEFSLESVDTSAGTYRLKVGEQYVTSETDAGYGYTYAVLTSTQSDAIVWKPLTSAEYATMQGERANAQAAAVASTAGLTGVTDTTSLVSALGSYFKTGVDKSSAINSPSYATLGDWTYVATAANNDAKGYGSSTYYKGNGSMLEMWNSCQRVYQTITGLSEGVYHITVNGTWRPVMYPLHAYQIGDSVSTTAWMYATTASDSVTVQLADWKDGKYTNGSDSIYSQSDFSTAIANDSSLYRVGTYIYVKEGESLTLGLTCPAYIYQGCLQATGWTLTYYEAPTTIDDGTYYLMNTADSTYFSRGGNYNQQICVQEAGLQMILTNSTTSTGAFTLQAADYAAYKGEDYYISTSGNLTGFYQNIQTSSPTTFSLESVDETAGTYRLKVGEQYVTSETDAGYGYTYAVLTSTQDDAIVWKPLTSAEYATMQGERANAQAAAVASTAGLTNVTDTTSLATALGSYFKSGVDKSSAINSPSYATLTDWTYVATAANNDAKGYGSSTYYKGNGSMLEMWNSCQRVYQTIENLPEGVYHITVNGTWRPVMYPLHAYQIGDKISTTAWMYATTASDSVTVQLADWKDGKYTNGADSIYSQSDFSTAIAADSSLYRVGTYIYVKEGESLTLGLTCPAYIDKGCLQATGWTLTYYEQTGVGITFSPDGYATTYYGDRDLTLPDGVTAYTVSVETSGDTKTAKCTAISGSSIAAGNAVLLKKDATTEATTETFAYTTATSSTYSDNALKGSDTDATTSSDATSALYYKLSYDSDGNDLGFYWGAEDGAAFTNPAHKGYLVYESNGDGSTDSEVKGMTLVFDDQATAIQSVNAATPQAAQGIYTLTGVRMSGDASTLPAGLYIINGKKTLVR